MCNAWNHPKSCDCGWGGTGHKGSNSNNQIDLFSSWPIEIPTITLSLESHTIPNARCPACGEYVFYYRNQYGSSVFFDELGPPWPKHPCTDNNKKCIPKPSDNNYRKSDFLWMANGWKLYSKKNIKELDSKIYALELLSLHDTNQLSLFFSSYGPHFEIILSELCNINLPIFVKQDSEIDFHITFLSKKNKVINIRCSNTLSEANRNTQKIINIQRQKPRKISIKVVESKDNKYGTSMSLAFEKAGSDKENR